MRLSEYISVTGTTQQHLASLVGVGRAFISLVAGGRRTPSPDVAARISAATGGEVSVAELLYPDGVPDGASLAPGHAHGSEKGESPHPSEEAA